MMEVEDARCPRHLGGVDAAVFDLPAARTGVGMVEIMVEIEDVGYYLDFRE